MSITTSYNVAPNAIPAVANSVATFNLPVTANINAGTTPKVYTISNSLFPVVGNTYQVTLNLSYSVNFSVAPTGFMGVYLVYQTVGNATIVRAPATQSLPLNVNYGFNTSLTIVYTHTLSTNQLCIYVDNLSSANIVGASSLFQVSNIAVTNVGTSGTTITATSFS